MYQLWHLRRSLSSALPGHDTHQEGEGEPASIELLSPIPVDFTSRDWMMLAPSGRRMRGVPGLRPGVPDKRDHH